MRQKMSKEWAFLDSIMENLPHMIFVKDAKDLHFVRFNRAGEELLGYSREELIGKNDYDFFPKDQADIFTQTDRETLRTKRVLDMPEARILTRNKGERLLRSKKIPLLDADGNPVYLLGISEDITEEKKARTAHESRLREQGARLEAEASASHFAYLSEAGSILAKSLSLQQTLEAFGSLAIPRLADFCLVDLGPDGASESRIFARHVDPKMQELLMKYLRSPELLNRIDAKSHLIWPLLARDRTLGMVTLGCSDGRCLTKAHVDLASDLISRAALAIDSALLYEESQKAVQTQG